MNYIAEIKAFYDLALSKALSTGQIALWHALMYINNKCAWTQWFTVPNQTLELLTGMSRQSITKNRNILKQLGYLDFKTNGTKATSYMLKSLQVGCQDSLQDSLQVGCQDSCQNSSTLNKQNKTKQYIAQSDTMFDTFWEAYPKHMGKEKARKAFAGLRVGESLLSDMLAALEVQKKQPQWQDKQYIPYPATWLNQRRWEDEILGPSSKTDDWRSGGREL